MSNIITIQANDYIANINVGRGGNCISLRNTRYNAVILREPYYDNSLDNPYLYGMPILFPVNRISNGGFEFEGRKYSFPINEPNTNCHLHGTLHETAFEVIEKTENSIICAYKADKNDYLGFPHSFEIRICYEVGCNGLLQKTEIVNLSEMNMPILLGFHTTFNSLFLENGKNEDIFVLVQAAEEFERNKQNYLPTGRKLDFDDVSKKLEKGMFNPFEKAISRHYSARGKKMVIYDNGNDISLVYENDEKLKFRLIYNGNADGYICLEPQSCLVDCVNSIFKKEETGFDFVKPNETKVYSSRIYLEEGDKR